MIVKSRVETNHAAHLKRVFSKARQCKMRFNSENCTFGVKDGKFLGFYLTEWRIEANPDMCREFSKLARPSSKKSIQVLNGVHTSLSCFMAKSVQYALPFFKLLPKEAAFDWTEECEKALLHFKKIISQPFVLSWPENGETLFLYFAFSTAVVRETLICETSEG